MKLFKKTSFRRLTGVIAAALCISLAPVPSSVPVSFVKEAEAAVKEGFYQVKRSNGEYDYYYYVKGKKITNKWKKITDTATKKSYWYYFGPKGRAYKAYENTLSSMYLERFVTKKIGTRTYGFDEFGHRIKGAWFSTKINKLFFFDGNGIYNSSKTSKLRVYAKKGRKASYLIKALGKPKKREVKAGGCFDIGSSLDDGSRLVYYTYDHITVVTSTDTSGKTETIHLVDANYRQ